MRIKNNDMLKKLLFIVLFLLICNANSHAQSVTDSLIQQLDQTILLKHQFDELKEKRIELLKKSSRLEKNEKAKFELNNRIIEEYKFYKFDLALKFIEQNIDIAEQIEDRSLIDKTRLTLGELLLESGRYKESIDALNEINVKKLPKDLLNEYYIAYKESYSGLVFNTSVKKSKERYSKLYNCYKDSLFTRLDPESEESLRLKEKQFRDNRQIKEATIINDLRLKKSAFGKRSYSLITFERSLLYELQKDIENQKKYLCLSAISDIRASVKDNASIGELAKIMFHVGDIDKAYKYINTSFADASFYNSQLRYVNIANSLPMITNAYEEKSSNQKAKLKKYLYAISSLALILIASIILIYNQLKKLAEARNKLRFANTELENLNKQLNTSNERLKKLYEELAQSDRIKENYIGTFLNLYSEYISKLDVYRKLVNKYVKSNQMNALLELSKSKQLIEEELEIFNKNFDHSFLHIYPSFIEEVNLLLLPEKQIQTSKKNSLTTELRILALIKLGITSSAKIAKILRYSVNTIYNYRAAIKNSAIDKNNFEANIKNIL